MHRGSKILLKSPVPHNRGRGALVCRGVELDVKTDGLWVTLIDFTLSRLSTEDERIAFSDLEADPDLFRGPKGDCQVSFFQALESYMSKRVLTE